MNTGTREQKHVFEVTTYIILAQCEARAQRQGRTFFLHLSDWNIKGRFTTSDLAPREEDRTDDE
jgi:hypothetical protein